MSQGQMYDSRSLRTSVKHTLSLPHAQSPTPRTPSPYPAQSHSLPHAHSPLLPNCTGASANEAALEAAESLKIGEKRNSVELQSLLHFAAVGVSLWCACAYAEQVVTGNDYAVFYFIS